MVEYAEARTRFTQILRWVLDDDSLSLTEKMALHDITDIDDFLRVELARALEREFSIAFSTAEIATFDDIDAIFGSVITHMGSDARH